MLSTYYKKKPKKNHEVVPSESRVSALQGLSQPNNSHFKILMMGHSSAKAGVLSCLTGKNRNPDLTTQGVDYESFNLSTGQKISIWDTAGQDLKFPRS